MRRALTAGAATVAFLLAGPTAAHAETVLCNEPVEITAITNFTTSGAGDVAVNRFDFTGTVKHCLPNNVRVDGVLAGSGLQVIRADGSGTIVVQETLTIPGGSTLDFVVLARFRGADFDGRIHTTSGTGELSRVHGRGTFVPAGPPTGPVGPTSFLSSVTYTY